MNKSVAVVIPVKNGFPEVKYCIESLLLQTIKPARIIVIDSGSTDESINYLKSVDSVKLIQIEANEFNHGFTRNLALDICNEEFIYYTVQDAIASNEKLLESLIEGFDDSLVAGVCGKQVAPRKIEVNPLEWYSPISPELKKKYYFPNVELFNELNASEKRIICGWDNVNAMYRRSILKQINFDYITFGEDMAWAKKAILSRFQIVYIGYAKVYHYHHENSEYTFRRCLTTLYFRYKNFNEIPEKIKLNFLSIIKIPFHLYKKIGFQPFLICKWFIYNVNQIISERKARKLSILKLSESENAFDRIHELYCSKSPMALKHK